MSSKFGTNPGETHLTFQRQSVGWVERPPSRTTPPQHNRAQTPIPLKASDIVVKPNTATLQSSLCLKSGAFPLAIGSFGLTSS